MNVLRHYMLVLLLLLLGSGFCGVWAQTVWYKKSSEVVFDGNTPYMIRSATSEKSNLSTRMPASDDKGDSGWRSTKVRVYQSDFTDLSQVFYFVKDASDHILMFTKDASGNRTYIDASSNNWDMNTVTVSGAVLP